MTENTSLQVDKIYVAHWNKLSDRKELLQAQFNEHNITDVEWVELYDKDSLNIDDLKKDYYRICDPKYSNGNLLTLAEISLILKHCWILKDMFDKQYQTVLILEDDAVFDNDFVNKFNEYKLELPVDWDICWVGSCCGLHAPYNEGTHVYKTDSSRCTHAYIISKAGLDKIIDKITGVNDSIDWYYNFLIKDLNLNNFWFEPSLVSQNSNFDTTIQPHNWL